MRASWEQIAEGKRATDRAAAALKPGDRLLIKRCAGLKVTVTLLGWDNATWMVSRSGISDIHALHVLKVNGVPTCFADVVELPDGRTVRRFIRYPEEVDDGTLRCVQCGQIDDMPWHDMDACVRSVPLPDPPRLRVHPDDVPF